MNEERRQAYFALIQALLSCPNGEEGQILQDHQELIDEEFLLVCQQVAQQLQGDGRENEAGFLLNLAQQLAEYLKNTTQAKATLLEEYLRFLMQVLKATEESRGDPSVVYPLLQRNLEKLDEAFVHILQAWASQTFSEIENKKLLSLAAVIGDFSNLIQKFPLGNQANNYEIGIAGYGIISTVFTQEKAPQIWASLQYNLGNAYKDRIQGERAENLDKAIFCYQAALQVYTRRACAENWAMTQDNLGIAYVYRIRGERAENLEQAISCYQAALQVHTCDAFPKDWAETQNNLGIAYSNRIRGEREENLEQAIFCYQAALQVYTCEVFPKDWAKIQNYLGEAYSKRIRGERAKNLEQAIAFYQTALQVYTYDAFPEQWAETQNNLGVLYLDRIRGERAENLEQATVYFEATLKVFTHDTFPEQWAATQNNLGRTYQTRIRGERAENLEQAIAFYQTALQFRTYDTFPEQWAETQLNLGGAYLYRIKGEQAENREIAIPCFEAALKVFTYDTFPEKWAMAQHNLGLAYQTRIRGERAENLEQAIAFYQTALQVRTYDAFPEQWAMTQLNLGNTYNDCIRGERGENLEQSIAYFEAALQVFTHDTFPEQWAMTQHNLGTVYQTRIRGERGENLEQSIAYFEAALQVFTHDTFPEQWAMTQNNLGNTYNGRIRGERGENLEQSIAYFEAALQVFTHDTFPEQWAMTQNNLGNAYNDRIRGERAENLERAITACQAALEVYTHAAFPQDWAMTQNNLGNAYLDHLQEENVEKAIAAFQAALEIYTYAAFPQDYTRNLNNLGIAYYNQFQHYASSLEQKQTSLQNAYNTLEKALDAVEYLRGEIVSGDEAKRKLNEEWNRLYIGMVEVCLELQNYTAALEYTDRSKARNLVELIATRDVYPQGEIPPEVGQRLQDLRQAIDREKRRLEQEEEKHRNYTHINQLREEFQEQYPYKPLSFDNIQSLLDEETAILEWYIIGDKFLTFTLTRQTLNLWTSSEEDLDNLIDWGNAYLSAYNASKDRKLSKTEAQKLRQEWQNSLPQRLETLSEILHLNDLLSNLFKNFPTCKKLILIPHRYLHLFPIHALPVTVQTVGADCIRPILPDRSNLEGASIAPLQEWFAKGVSYAPNCQLLQQAQNRPRPDFNSLFAISNPTEDLSFADLEVETIRKSFPKDQRATLRGQNATKAAFLAKDFAQTHHLYFSCHGVFDPNSPLDSGLQLADDVLTLTEIISSLNLSQCSLVTLSACETGQVALDNTDEYISIASGFILAGSPSVIVTLWSVNQISTALLLIKTYETLQKHPGKLAISLKTAQMWLRDTTVRDFHQWTQNSPLLTDDWRNNLKEFFQQMGEDKELGWDDTPYQSLYHWAAFCIVGQGEQ